MQGFEVEKIEGSTYQFRPRALCIDQHHLGVHWHWNDGSPIDIVEHNRAVTHQFLGIQNQRTYQVCMEVIREDMEGNRCEAEMYCESVNVSIGGVNKQSISVFPNPTTGQLHIELPNAFDASSSLLRLQLSDLQGKTILQQELVADNRTLIVEVNDLPIGVYLLSVFDAQGNEHYYEKVVKK